MKKILAGVLGMMLFAIAAQAAPIFVGSWFVGDGPHWSTNPQVLSARETAALLFGGVYTDYSISTIDSNPANINFRAHVDGWGDFQYLELRDVDQDYKLDLGAPGYDDPQGEGTAYSAYVLDHSCHNRWEHPEEPCLVNPLGRNFAFRNEAAPVPEPPTLFLLGAVLMGGFGVMRRKMRS